MLDYGARLYDPLTTRWNGVDALAEKYHSTTGYGYVAGNPINAVDPDGRRTLYLSSSGRPLSYLSNDNLPDAITFVSDANILSFYQQRAVAANPNDSDLNKTLRGLGISYMVEGIVNFYDSNKNNGAAGTTIEGTTYDHIEFKGKSIKLAAERGIFLYESNGVVQAGDPKYYYTSNKFETIDGEDKAKGYVQNNLGTRVSSMHTHPDPGDYYVYPDPNSTPWIQTDAPGPSGTMQINGKYDGDLGTGAYDNRYFNIVVDNSNIYFYKKTSQSIIKIPKSIFR